VPALNHHIVGVTDKDATSRFFAEIFGFDQPVRLGPFALVQVTADTTLDFVDTDGDIHSQHYAFLVTEEEFDEIFARVRERHLPYWSDPEHHDPEHINHWDDGRGVYFPDPNGHNLEIITRPYGSGGTTAIHPHPLIAPPVTPDSAAHS
jgi:catechol 2,3-dioxygenase-like lactoylglutathione lyase family enzyme